MFMTDSDFEDSDYSENNESETSNITFHNDDLNSGDEIGTVCSMDLYKLICDRNIVETKKITEKYFLKNNDDTTSETDDDNYENSNYDDGKSNISVCFVNETQPLVLSSKLAIPELVNYYLDHKCDPNYRPSNYHMTALLSVCNSKKPQSISFEEHKSNVGKCINLLLIAGADVSHTTRLMSHSALHLLAANNYSDLCGYFTNLLEIDILNSRNCTPIMIAAARGATETVAYLKKAGADLMLRNVVGLTALELALMSGHSDIVDLLSVGSKGAAVDSTKLSDFYTAWSLVHKDLLNVSSDNDKQEANKITDNSNNKSHTKFRTGCTISSLCSSLNMQHLEPILYQNNWTIADLRCMGDSELKRNGITKYLDRKTLLHIFQEMHKKQWADNLTVPNYKMSLKPGELSDFMNNINEHLEFISSTVRYLGLHLEVNPTYYTSQTTNQTNFFDKLSDQGKYVISETRNIRDSINEIDGIFDRIYLKAFEDDEAVQINEANEDNQLDLIGDNSKPSRLRLFIGASIACTVTLAAMKYVMNR